MVGNYELKGIVKRLETIEQSGEDVFEFVVEFKVTGAFKVNLFFKEDKDMFVKEYLIKRLFVLYYPLSLNVVGYEIVDVLYGLDLLKVSFTLSYDDYVGHICAVFKYYLF